MARVKDPAFVKDDLQNLLVGLAKVLNRRHLRQGGASPGEPSSRTLRSLPSKSVERSPGK
jgi:hypothetical protein